MCRPESRSASHGLVVIALRELNLSTEIPDVFELSILDEFLKCNFHQFFLCMNILRVLEGFTHQLIVENNVGSHNMPLDVYRNTHWMFCQTSLFCARRVNQVK